MPRSAIVGLIAALGLAAGCGHETARPASTVHPSVGVPSPVTQQSGHPLPAGLRARTKKVELCKHHHNTPESALIWRISRWT